MKRPVDSLTAEDFAKSPVWRYTNSDLPDETYVMPVRRLPVEQVDGCVVGCHIYLANRTVLTGFLGNLDTTNRRLTEHFLALSVFRSDGALFHFARYHDFDVTERSPMALAAFIRLPLEAVFPITYDVSGSVIGPADVIRGVITAEPKERLTQAELIALAVP